MSIHYLNYVSQSDHFRGQIEENFVTSAGQKTVNQTHISNIYFNIPPLPEQIRIADKLDALLARVEAGRERLERVPKLVKAFRQAVLSAAVSGELTREWRGGGDAAWEKIAVNEIAHSIFDGPFGSHLKSDDYTDGGVRVIRLENLGHLYFRDTKKTFISEEKYRTIERHTLQNNDVLFSSFVDEEIRACIYINDYGLAINKADCFVIRCNHSLYTTKMLLYAISNQSTYRHFSAAVHGATRPRINLKQLKEFELPYPPLLEQAEIIRRVEALFALADRLEARYQSALTSFGRLTPALLAKAFRGELVPQDPNDEPASVLLERIRAQRAAEGSKPKRGRGAAPGSVEEPRRRGRPPKAQAEVKEQDASVEAAAQAPDIQLPRRRGRPPKVRPDAQAPAPATIPKASSYEDAVRKLEALKLKRAGGTRQVSLFDEE